MTPVLLLMLLYLAARPRGGKHRPDYVSPDRMHGRTKGYAWRIEVQDGRARAHVVVPNREDWRCYEVPMPWYTTNAELDDFLAGFFRAAPQAAFTCDFEDAEP